MLWYIYAVKKLLALLLIVVFGLLIVFTVNARKNKISSKAESSPTPTPANLTKLKLGVLQVASGLQYYVAREKGYFVQEGLDIEPVTMKSGALIPTAVASGDINIGWSQTGTIISAHENGFDFQYITGGVFKDSSREDFHQILVLSDSGISSPKDLEGKKFVSSSSGSGTDFWLTAWAKENSVNVKKVSLTQIPYDQMEQALLNKQVDGGLFNEPYLTVALSDGKMKVLDSAPYGFIAKKFMFSGWFAKKSWIDENPQIVASFNRAIEKATNYINSNPSDLADILAKGMNLNVETAKKMRQPVFDTVIRKGDIQPFIDGMSEFGFLKGSFPEQEIAKPQLQ